ncbi:dsrm domain-containing protein/DEAD domain-containing protein/Helicase_C domain-containing protein/Ribonuclease_3 domain-containing protein/PAZ domain-containing protein/dsRNA_bind domain-containing protein [Cephalotus follicularis]|uniref:Endoribonuclease Dicer homolog 1 n=1 Tax=Cephalotus follicularis TaxID=3775 RepID=A0A1Q3CJG4_CEPFO|nr:dsrm domain-containing protein/DEAD domain-containing protein/Helicase_C domain-containing protein/Ribonuclease_3 domain-containing protein/PAZ domain-containing protein/dsRNA_bind domain-containing protein [Cephalotus follicularis]
MEYETGRASGTVCGGGGDLRPSYWLDACEDISCDLIDDFVNFDILIPDSADIASNQDNLANDFFGGIDHILDSIKNGSGLPPPVSSTDITTNGNGDGFQDCSTGKDWVQNEAPDVCHYSYYEDVEKDDTEKKGIGDGKLEEKFLNNSSKENGVVRNGNRASEAQSRRRNFDSDERVNKRSRVTERQFSSREQCYTGDRERDSNRKRQHDWGEIDRRNRDHIRRRENYNGHGRRDGRDRSWRDREPRGYWERDRSGSFDMVFRLGAWEADHSREGKEVNDRIQECNGKVEKKSEEAKEKLPEEQARQYQLDVLEQARKGNTIAFLETGAGKTLIAILLIRSVCSDLQIQNKKMLAVFLVPKVPLVYQQAEVIREQTHFQVGHYCGEMGQDFWDARRWQWEFETKQVLVMTAQILLNILRHSIVKMEEINLLILDECHHAVKKHPYSLVMSEFYHTTPKEKRPSVFGMTASPVNLKGVSSQVDCAIKIRNLESKLDSVVCTIKDRKDLEKHVPMPSEVVVEYDKAASLWSFHEQIKQMEIAVEEAAQSSSRRSKWQFMGARDAGAKEELRQVYGVSERSESDGAANLIQKLRAINYALSELGQWCAYKVAQSFLTALQSDERVNYQLDVKFQESYLNKVVALLQCHLSEGAVSDKDTKVADAENEIGQNGTDHDEIEEGELPEGHVVSGGEHVDVIIGAAVADGKVTPKVQSLIKILLKYQHTDDFRAIIFVERVVSALVLPKVFAELPSLSFIKCASLIGHNNSQEMRTSQMQDTIAKFRDGRVTLLVATSVAEEGLDIRQCNVVIRFDLAKTVLAYIQSRGRARKPGSDYILMVERGNLSHGAFLRNARNSEETLRKEAIERTDISHIKDTSRLISVQTVPGTVYQVESTGAIVSLNSAVGLIHFFCSQLPSDRYSILRPEFIMEKHEKPGGPTEYSCRLQLPCNAPFEKLEGPVCSSMRLAQQAVCLDACKKLHEMGAFTDMLLPDKGSGEEREKVDKNDEGDPLPGTARHREFYPEGVANILQGEWILSGRDDCSSSKMLHLYMYAVSCVNSSPSNDPFLTQVSDFAVVFGNELDAEVLSMSMDLFIARTMITKASLVFKGAIDITESQLGSLKNFHVRLMSIVLDVDVEPSTTPWDPAKAYLFVPVVGDNSMDPVKEIDWGLIDKLIGTDAWSNPLQRARPDVYLGTNERTLGGDRREYGFGKLRNGMAFGQKSHPTYGIRGAVAQFDVVKASGLVPNRDAVEVQNVDLPKGELMMADTCFKAEYLVGRIVTAAHSGKRFYVDSIRYDMTAENSFPRKAGYLGPLEYSSYADYYKQKYGVNLIFKEQPLIRGRGVSYCKNLLSPRFEYSRAQEGESEGVLDKTYYVFLPPELCFVHPLPGSLVRGAQRLPSIMRRVESMLLAIQLKGIINYPVPASKILEALTAASCQETFCYERAELLGDAYLKWIVSRFLFLKYPQKHEGQLTRMRQQMVSNLVLYRYALSKGLQSYIQADRFAPSRWAAPGVLPVFDEDTKDGEASLFDQERSPSESELIMDHHNDYEDEDMEDGELESDSSSYRVLSSKTLADVVEALIGVYYVDGGKTAANHLMKWIGIEVESDPDDIEGMTRPSNVPESILRSIDFDALESALNIKFNNWNLLVEAITHASRPSSGVSCYQRLEFVGDAVLDHLITRHLFFTYTNLPPGRLTDLRAAAVNNENFARVAVKHKLHVHLRHGSSALERQIRDFVKEVQVEFSKPGLNSFGLGDCKAPKVLGDIVESIAGAIFLDSGRNTAVVWKVFQPLLHPMVTPETLPMHPVRELQERCQQQAEGLEYKATRNGNLATVEVFIDGVQVGVAQNPQKKMAQKLAARNALAILKEKETAEAKEKGSDENGRRKKNGNQTFTRQTLNDICLRRNWPMPFYRCVNEGGPAHAKRFTFAVRVNTNDKGWTDECVGEPMPSVKKAKDSAAVLLLDLLSRQCT